MRFGAGVVTRPDRDEEAFVIQVRPTSNLLDADGTTVEIIPKMVAQIDILSGKKTVLEDSAGRECPVFCVTGIWSMLPERSKDYDDFQGTVGRTAEGLRAA